MKPFPRSFSLWFCAAWLAISPAHSDEPVTDAGKLWRAFLEIYSAESFHPVKSDEVDQKARQALIAALPQEQVSKLTKESTTLPQLVQEVAQITHDDASALTELAIQRVMPLIDRYGSYETSNEVLALQDAVEGHAQKRIFAMRLVMDKKNVLRCYPDPDGPAAKAGLPGGARLIKANGIALEGKSLSTVRQIITQHATLDLIYQMDDAAESSVQIFATDEVFPDVQVYPSGDHLRLRIRHFSEGTAAWIKSEMAKHANIPELTIDVRGNDGGLLQETLITCSHFLPAGAIIATDVINGKKVRKRDDNEQSITVPSITILMDGATASGAELLICCLKFHMKDQVKIRGSNSYGKHFRTVRTQVLDAGMLTITDGIILGPDGNSWPETGIKPDP